MIDVLFSRAQVLTRLRSGPAGPLLEDLANLLHGMGYRPNTIRAYIRSAELFCVWLGENGRSPADVTPALIDRYVRELGRRPRPGRPRGRLPDAAFGLRQFSEVLRRRGVIGRPPVAPGPWDEWLAPYDRHLEGTMGLAPGTRQAYLRHARALLSHCHDSPPTHLRGLTPEKVADFARRSVFRLKPSSSRLPVTATRAFLRYLVARDMVPSGLENAVPTVRQWKLATLPRHLPAGIVARALESPSGGPRLRDRAILLLLARLGLRAGEVSRLSLDDIDWREGRVVVRAGKSGRERMLPLPAEVGRAVARYLGRNRPASSSRRVFLGCLAPHFPLAPGAVSEIARRALLRAGARGPRLGAHSFRHSAATEMVRRGVSFKEVADVLGHARLETTAIYAKLDAARLAGVALPWPGGSR